jgi:choline dehydrogenase-like flavoprotein
VERPVDRSTYGLLSGRILGGGSSVNNLSVVRPIRRDFDEWVRYGGGLAKWPRYSWAYRPMTCS